MNQTVFVLMACVLLIAACAKKPGPRPAPQPEPQPPSTEFPFTNQSETISAEEIKKKTSGSTQSLAADFNLDGLQDLAVVDSAEKQKDQVLIYIQKSDESSDGAASPPTYYKGGAIRWTIEGEIVGVMSRQGKTHADLILLISHTNAPREMVHYRNDGTRFNVAGIHDRVRGSHLLQEEIPLDPEPAAQK